MLFNKLDELVQKHESINHQLQNPSIAAQQDKFRQLMKEHAELDKIVKVYQEYKTLTRNLEENKILLTTESDEDLRQMAKDDIAAIEPRIEPLA